MNRQNELRSDLGAPRPGERFLRAFALWVGMIAAVTAAFLIFTLNLSPTGFFRIGDRFPPSPRVGALRPLVFAGEPGFDGQFFLTIALDPLLQEPGSVAALDEPGYRYRRILYPALGWLLAGGVPWLIPWALVAINVASFAALCTLLAKGTDDSWWRGGLFFCCVGAWVSLFMSTADLLSTLLVLAFLLDLARHRPARASVLLGAAALTREVNLVLMPVSLLAGWRDAKLRGVLYNAAALLPAVGWNVYVLQRFPSSRSIAGTTHNFGWPFEGLWAKATAMAASPFGVKPLMEAFLLASLLIAGAWCAGQRAWWRDERWVLAASSALFMLIICLSSTQVLGYFVNHCRVFLPVLVIAAAGWPRPGQKSLTLGAVFTVQALGSLGFLITRFAAGGSLLP
ncbi:hypothetical protein HRbin09_01527 [bacterium HR09]|nr:hypothetical protein HRbin09_01527 [bacterium HR09]